MDSGRLGQQEIAHYSPAAEYILNGHESFPPLEASTNKRSQIVAVEWDWESCSRKVNPCWVDHAKRNNFLVNECNPYCWKMDNARWYVGKKLG